MNPLKSKDSSHTRECCLEKLTFILEYIYVYETTLLSNSWNIVDHFM